MDANFYETVKNSSAHTACRNKILQMVLSNKDYQTDLFEIALNLDDKNHYKAIWIAEMLAEKHFDFIPIYIPKFLDLFGQLKHQSALRGGSRILMFIHQKSILTKLQQEKVIEICLDWLVGNYKVVVKWCSLQILADLSQSHVWIKDEL